MVVGSEFDSHEASKYIQGDLQNDNIDLNPNSFYINSYGITEKQILSNPDKELLSWLEKDRKRFLSEGSSKVSK